MISGAYLTRTLAVHPYREAILRILGRAIQAVEPEKAVKQYVQRQGDSLRVGDQEYILGRDTRIKILAVGKAAYAMSAPLVEMLADRAPQGLLIPKHLPDKPVPGLDCQVGGHPIPDENSLRAGKKAVQLVQGLSEDDLLICLISGRRLGADERAVSGDCINRSTATDCQPCWPAGRASTRSIRLRRHLDRLKGGGLARLAAPARVVSLILSDVVGNALEAIASGPTAPDPTTRADALNILEKYGLRAEAPSNILKALETAPETPKPGDSPLRAGAKPAGGQQSDRRPGCLAAGSRGRVSHALFGRRVAGGSAAGGQGIMPGTKEFDRRAPLVSHRRW